MLVSEGQPWSNWGVAAAGSSELLFRDLVALFPAAADPGPRAGAEPEFAPRRPHLVERFIASSPGRERPGEQLVYLQIPVLQIPCNVDQIECDGFRRFEVQ